MDRVSCQAFTAVRTMARHAGVSMEALVHGLAAGEVWQDERAWIAWDDWVAVFDRLAVALRHDAALSEAACLAILDYDGRELGAQLKQACTTPRALFEMLGRYAFPASYGPARFEVETSEEGVISFTVSIAEGFRGTRPWLVAFEGGLGPMPVLAGLGTAQLERVELTERRASWRITPHVKKEAPTELASARLLVDELMRQQATLTAALEAAAGSEREYRAALEALPMLVALHDGGTLHLVNAAFAEAFGQPAEALVGQPLAALVPPGVRAELEGLVQAPAAGWRRFDLGAQVLWLRGAGVVTLGRKPWQLLLGADSTREAKVLARARRSEAASALLLGALPDLVLRFDEGLVLQAVYGGGDFAARDELRGLVGCRLDELQRRMGLEPEAASQRLVDEATRTLETGVARAHLHRRRLPPDGAAREYVVRYVPCEGGLLFISHDRTRELADQQRLERAEREAASGELAAGVAAEVERPVADLLSKLGTLREACAELGPDAVVDELLAEVEAGGVRIRDTAARLREFALVQPSARRSVAVAEVVERAQRMTNNELRYRARVQAQVEPGLEVWADPRELEQVLVGLLTQAAQAMPEVASPETHHVWLTAWADGPKAVISVTDDGHFAGASELPHLFEPFASARGSATLGSGLGLAICRRLVAAQGGSLEASSVPGRTRVVLTLPKQAPPISAADLP